MRGLAIAAALLLVFPVQAQEQTAWQEEKCTLFTDAWTRALENMGSDDINFNFLATTENFIASGCTETMAACPQSNQERDIADLVTIAMMNEGAASTFLPFRCPTQ